MVDPMLRCRFDGLHVSANVKMTIREFIRKHITEYQQNQYKEHGSEIRDFFGQTLKGIKAFFQIHPKLIATQAYKAKCSIIIERETYSNKVENLLEIFFKILFPVQKAVTQIMKGHECDLNTVVHGCLIIILYKQT